MTRKKVKYPSHKVKAQILKEAAPATLPPPQLVNVRAAKDQLSSLLERAAGGDEVIITSSGVPKAKLVPFLSTRKPFRMDWAHLRSMKVNAGATSAEELVRADRDGRA